MLGAFPHRGHDIEPIGDQPGPPAVLDLIATTGFYSVLAYLLNSFDTPIDGDILAALEIAPPPA